MKPNDLRGGVFVCVCVFVMFLFSYVFFFRKVVMFFLWFDVSGCSRLRKMVWQLPCCR